MLFIYGALRIGGVETFFVRMAKQRHLDGLSTNILLLSKEEDSDLSLLTEIKKYSNVYFYHDIFYGGLQLVKLIPLLLPLKENKLKDMFKTVDQIHVNDGELALLGYSFIKRLKVNIPITAGFYHYMKYAWGGTHIREYEKTNREFILNYLPKKSLSLFSQGTLDFYNNIPSVNLTGAQTFRLGVVDSIKIDEFSHCPLPSKFKICTVGRLVNFKSYNLFMLDVVNELKKESIDIEYHIYGYGDLQEEIELKIKKLGLENCIKLKGSLNYNNFNKVVSDYDLFIGSGTAIIQAASLGVCSIVGIEKIETPDSYGFFSDVYKHEYNLKGLNIPLKNVTSLVLGYIRMTDEARANIKNKHINSITDFTNINCSKALDSMKTAAMPLKQFKYNVWLHQISKLIDAIHIRLNKQHPRNNWNK